jgi:hypothetical protein
MAGEKENTGKQGATIGLVLEHKRMTLEEAVEVVNRLPRGARVKVTPIRSSK